MLTITTSWDDGDLYDTTLAALLDQYGVKGTFYITKHFRPSRLSEEEIRSLAKRHEVGAHTLMHPDFTIIVTWAKFLGTYNARLFDLADAVKQNKTARIRLIWLNADMQKSWNLTKEQKLEIK